MNLETVVKFKQFNSKAIIGIAFLIAILFHLAAFFWLQNIDIAFYSSVNALWENQKKDISSSDEAKAKKAEEKRRHQMLTTFFKEMSPPRLEKIETLNFDLKDQEQAYSKIDIDAVDTNLSFDEHGLDSFKKSSAELQAMERISPIQAAREALSENSTSNYRQENVVDILFLQNQELVNELIKATEEAQGSLKAAPTETVTTANSIQAGTSETAPLLTTTSFNNRSGLLDQGLIDIPQSQNGSILTLANIGSAPAPSTINFQAKPRQANLPNINKNSLRGFNTASLESAASSNDFTLKVEYAPRSNGHGYVFKLTLFPKPNTKFKRIVQNVFFLVDRSHSIRFNRFEMTKQAVSKMISTLQPGDTFNVLFFDEKIQRFSPENVPWNPVNVARAQQFIAKQKHGGPYATTDLYSSLGEIIPHAVAENEINTAILLSDGDTYLGIGKQREMISRWTSQNEGKVSLFSVASGKGNNVALLDLLSVLNQGNLYYAPTDQIINEALHSLMHEIRNPIGKEMKIAVLTQTPGQKISVYPSNKCAANLYQNRPYTLYGTTDQLKDFYLFFQGKYYDKSLDIKQTASFGKAAKGDSENLEKQLALYQAYENYGRFLNDGNPIHLHEAQQILVPFNVPVAFQ